MFQKSGGKSWSDKQQTPSKGLSSVKIFINVLKFEICSRNYQYGYISQKYGSDISAVIEK
jgi:hypothetical protein